MQEEEEYTEIVISRRRSLRARNPKYKDTKQKDTVNFWLLDARSPEIVQTHDDQDDMGCSDSDREFIMRYSTEKDDAKREMLAKFYMSGMVPNIDFDTDGGYIEKRVKPINTQAAIEQVEEKEPNIILQYFLILAGACFRVWVVFYLIFLLLLTILK